MSCSGVKVLTPLQRLRVILAFFLFDSFNRCALFLDGHLQSTLAHQHASTGRSVKAHLFPNLAVVLPLKVLFWQRQDCLGTSDFLSLILLLFLLPLNFRSNAVQGFVRFPYRCFLQVNRKA